MALIRLQDVTKIYPGGASVIHSQRGKGYQSRDRAFDERVTAQADREQSRQTRHDGPVAALDHVNLTVLNGQTMAVIGPSGCGKSTLLRVIAGVEAEYTGTIFYDGQDMRAVPTRNRHIGMVFQNYALYPHFRGRGNLAFFFKLHGVSDEETEKRIRVTSKIMGIGFKELLKRKPGTLSGGQQQRVAIARAIVRTPRLFLFDEPLSSLDAKLRTQTRAELKRLLQRFQITSIYVTHDQVEAIALADRMAVMREGRIEQVGTYNWLRQNPVNAFVAGFVGNPPMNMFTGTVDNKQLCLREIAIPLPDWIKPRLSPGRKVTLGVRPEAGHVAIGDQASLDGFRLRGVIEVAQPDFAHHTRLIYLRTGTLVYATITQLEPPLKIDDKVDVIFPTNKFYFFDGETGERIQ
jgi:ABC-type sugar transport system ATPase subunit